MIKKDSSICINCVCLAMCISKTDKKLLRDCSNLNTVISVNSTDAHLTVTHFHGLDRNVCTETLGEGTIIIRGIYSAYD